MAPPSQSSTPAHSGRRHAEHDTLSACGARAASSSTTVAQHLLNSRRTASGKQARWAPHLLNSVAQARTVCETEAAKSRLRRETSISRSLPARSCSSSMTSLTPRLPVAGSCSRHCTSTQLPRISPSASFGSGTTVAELSTSPICSAETCDENGQRSVQPVQADVPTYAGAAAAPHLGDNAAQGRVRGVCDVRLASSHSQRRCLGSFVHVRRALRQFAERAHDVGRSGGAQRRAAEQRDVRLREDREERVRLLQQPPHKSCVRRTAPHPPECSHSR